MIFNHFIVHLWEKNNICIFGVGDTGNYKKKLSPVLSFSNNDPVKLQYICDINNDFLLRCYVCKY